MQGFKKIMWYDNEKEYPDVLCYDSVNSIHQHNIPNKIQERIMVLLDSGEVNKLSSVRVKWNIIDGWY